MDDKVVVMSFDPTISNTGQRNGSYHLLEVQLKKEILWLSRRHYMFELVIGIVFENSMEPSLGLI